MRKVKCRVTGESGYDCEFYKAENGRYYKNKNVYDNWIIQKEYNPKIFYLINSRILNKRANNCASLIGKLIKESGLDAKTLYESILENINYIKDIITTSQESDSSKIYTIFTIATKRLSKVTYAGCYEIKNDETGEVYIGESIDLFGRFTNHVAELYENKHHCKKLQEAFNETKSISNFTITPLFMFPISSIDKNELKHETLYLEAAFYLIYKSKNKSLYNTQNPYVALKNNSVLLDGYDIDCKTVLQLLVEDKYGVVSRNLLNSIKENLRSCGFLSLQYVKTNETEDIPVAECKNTVCLIKDNDPIYDEFDMKNNEECMLLTANLLKNNVKLYRITNLLKEFAEEGILPKDYDYAKIRQLLVKNNLIKVDEFNHTIATDYALENHLYLLSNIHTRSGKTIYNYYISEKGKRLLAEIFLHYTSEEF